MRTLLTLLLIFLVSDSWSQSPHQISDTDTTLDYKTRFYKNGVPDLNGYYVYIMDSATYFSTDTARYYDFTKRNYNLDTSVMYRLAQGRWMEHYTFKKQKFFSLSEYKGGYLMGKGYDFTENGTLYTTFKRYPKIKGSIFNGCQTIHYDKKGQHITRIEYKLFEEDQTMLAFWYSLSYSDQGKLTYYSYYNEKAGIHEYIEYNKKGEVKKEYLRNSMEWYDKKWNARRTKMKLVKRGKSTKTIALYRKEKLVREKVIKY